MILLLPSPCPQHRDTKSQPPRISTGDRVCVSAARRASPFIFLPAPSWLYVSIPPCISANRLKRTALSGSSFISGSRGANVPPWTYPVPTGAFLLVTRFLVCFVIVCKFALSKACFPRGPVRLGRIPEQFEACLRWGSKAFVWSWMRSLINFPGEVSRPQALCRRAARPWTGLLASLLSLSQTSGQKSSPRSFER